ncbi:hypothetical protein K435DRAFT_728250 [Dendrothele bispora CBS 962.96]|uniref:MARVEL domain-containing protein n=1 Tax=Dendrothele bispora (strain CBS 962.96) TaxID=1314807 RepID=A0A4S8LMT3_DENBC|nr:hypothetical protein K435DRAFT_728250 [Dendrothele bispora CBS 962.96]
MAARTPEIGLVRIGLYITLLVFSFILFCLCCARIHYTTTLSRRDPLNNGVPFYDPSVAELIFTTLVTMMWIGFMMFLFFKRMELKFPRLFRDELIIMIILWVFWLGGTSAATAVWPDLSFCQQFETCRVLSALLGFAWLGFITLTFLIGVSCWMSYRRGGLTEPLPVNGTRSDTGATAGKTTVSA